MKYLITALLLLSLVVIAAIETKSKDIKIPSIQFRTNSANFYMVYNNKYIILL